MWEVPIGTQQSETVVNRILEQIYRPELAQYLHAALFVTTTARLLKAIKQDLMNMWLGLTENSSRSTLKNQGMQQLNTCT